MSKHKNGNMIILHLFLKSSMTFMNSNITNFILVQIFNKRILRKHIHNIN